MRVEILIGCGIGWTIGAFFWVWTAPWFGVETSTNPWRVAIDTASILFMVWLCHKLDCSTSNQEGK